MEDEMPKAECETCGQMFPLDVWNMHVDTCTGVVVPIIDDNTLSSEVKEKKSVSFAVGGNNGGDAAACNEHAFTSISGGNDPTTLPASYRTRTKYKGETQERATHVGLMNQGATCYMNSLLQTLFMSSDFRNDILSWEIPEEMRTDLNVPFQLQSLFMRMGYSTKAAVETKALTKSFRWTSAHHFAQHDVQELNRVLFEALQKYIDHLKTGNNFLVRLFEGTLSDYIECKVCGGRRERVDTFQDVTVTIKDTKSLGEALEKFAEVEEMTGGNSIYCEKCDKNQDSLKGLRFKTLPPILTVQMRRFDFDFTTFKREKVYDDVRVPSTLNLSQHLPTPTLSDATQLRLLALAHSRRFNTPLPGDLLQAIHPYLHHHTYELFSVLAHRGTTSSGHYIAYIRELQKDRRDWYCFNDEWVTKAEPDALTECLDPAQWQADYEARKAAQVVQTNNTYDTTHSTAAMSIPTSSPPVAVEFNWKEMGEEIPQVRPRFEGGVVIVDRIEGCPLRLNDIILSVDGVDVNSEGEWIDTVAPEMLHQVKVKRAPPTATPVVGEVCTVGPVASAPPAPEHSDPSDPLQYITPAPEIVLDANSLCNDNDGEYCLPSLFPEYGPSPSPAMLNAQSSRVGGLPSVTSRMYPYMAVYRLRGSDPTAPDIHLPQYLSETITKEAEEFARIREEYEQVKDLVELKLCPGGTWVTVCKEDTIWEATLKCVEAAGVDLPLEDLPVTLENTRLRYFIESKGVAGRTLYPDVKKCFVGDTGLSPLTAVCIERRADDQEPFIQHNDDDIKVFLSVYDREKKFETERKCVVVAGHATLAQLVEAVAGVLAIPSEKLVLTKTKGAHTASVLFEPVMQDGDEANEALLKASIHLTHDVCCSELLFVESTDDAADVSDPVLRRHCGGLEPSPHNAVNEVNTRKLCTVWYTLPGEEEPMQNMLRTPLLTPTKELRQLIATTHSLDLRSFVVRDASLSTNGRVLKFPDKPIQAYAQSTLSGTKEVKLTVLEESPLDEDEMAVEVHYLEKKPGFAQYLCKVVARGDALLEDFKRAMAEKEEVARLGIDVENMRVRKMEKDKKNRFEKAFIEKTWKECLPGVHEKISVVVEKGVAGEKLAKMSLFLVMQKYMPRTGEYGPLEEVVVSKRSSCDDILKVIGERHGVEDYRRLRVTKVHLKQPQEGADSSSNKKLFWRHTDPSGSGGDTRAVMGAPFKFEQDCLIAWKDTMDDPEGEQPTAPVIELLDNTPNTESNLRPQTAKAPEPRERGIVIRTEWDPESPVEQPLENTASQVTGEDNDQAAARLLSAPGQIIDNYNDLQGGLLGKTFASSHDASILNTDCCICLGKLEDGDAIYELPCNHAHHTDCLSPWLEQKPLCPTCNEPAYS